MDNLQEDSYEKTFARKDITDKGDKDWRKIFNFRYRIKDYIQDGYRESECIGLQYVNEYSETSLTWTGRYKIYRLFFRDSFSYRDKGKWCLKYKSWRNDHVCGG